MNTKIDAKKIPSILKEISEEASTIYPTLSKALEGIYRFFELEKATLARLRRNEFLASLLEELIKDSKVLIAISYLNQKQKQDFLNQMSAAERYWFEKLFPRWLSQLDGKFEIWRDKFKQGQVTQKDATVINQVTKELSSRHVSCIQRYICDLSMATDLIASHDEHFVCIQLTTSQNYTHLEDKVKRWLNTLEYWYIERGLFVRYSSGVPSAFAAIADKVMDYMEKQPEPMREEIVVF